MNNSCCVSDSSRLHMQRYDIRQGRIAHFGPRWFTFVLFGSLWFKMVLFRPPDMGWGWYPSEVDVSDPYPDFERHIWWSPASYMMIAYVIYDASLCHIWHRLMPNMPPVCTQYADVWRHLSWRCYTLGEWVIFMLPSRRETATLSAK